MSQNIKISTCTYIWSQRVTKQQPLLATLPLILHEFFHNSRGCSILERIQTSQRMIPTCATRRRTGNTSHTTNVPYVKEHYFKKTWEKCLITQIKISYSNLSNYNESQYINCNQVLLKINYNFPLCHNTVRRCLWILSSFDLTCKVTRLDRVNMYLSIPHSLCKDKK